MLWSLLALGLALADEVDEEVVVVGDGSAAAWREALDTEILELGYREGIRRGDHVVYRAEDPWKPRIVVYDAGYAVFEREPPHVGPMANGPWGTLGSAVCIPPIVCAYFNGWAVSKRRYMGVRDRHTDAIAEELRGWREAVADEAFQWRLDYEIPQALEALWRDGTPLQAGEPALATPEARRAAVLDFWATRTDTESGRIVQEVVEAWLASVVQPSEWPVTEAEADAAAERCGCGRRPIP